MKTIYLICDESGAKGYSDKQEKYLGEVGVMAGFVFPSDYLLQIRRDMDQMMSQYPIEGKCHITDLIPGIQNRLRKQLFSYLKERNLLCLYEAIYSEGFYGHYKMRNDLKKQMRDQHRSEILRSNNQSKELMHEHLFRGLIGKAVALCTDYIGAKFHLAVITDTIDASIKINFEHAVKEFLSFGTDFKDKIVTGFNPIKKEVVNGIIASKSADSNNLLDDFSSVKFTIESDDSYLTCAADVIANSLRHYFESRGENSIGTALNKKDAINGHPLDSLIYGVWGTDKLNYCADALFMHPKNSS